ncbi:MAG: hypothetical protein ABJB86_02460 [Bacteroidota bacterium]
MKCILMLLMFTVSTAIKAQEKKPVAQLLKEPAAWAFERFTLPPVFAPNFPYKGVEELRFSPGMFDKNSTEYFTYAFAAQLNGRNSMSKDEVNDYLFNYFKGLCSSTAKDRKLVVDTSKITVSTEKKKDTGKETIYNAILHVFGVFADGAAVQLNMEVKVLRDAGAKKVYLIFIASPHAKTDDAWKQLYVIQKIFSIPAQK